MFQTEPTLRQLALAFSFAGPLPLSVLVPHLPRVRCKKMQFDCLPDDGGLVYSVLDGVGLSGSQRTDGGASRRPWGRRWVGATSWWQTTVLGMTAPASSRVHVVGRGICWDLRRLRRRCEVARLPRRRTRVPVAATAWFMELLMRTAALPAVGGDWGIPWSTRGLSSRRALN